MKKKLKFILLSIIAAVSIWVIMLLGLISYSSKILNPFIGVNALIKMERSDKKVEQISDNPVRYISRGEDDFTAYMESQGYTVEQYGRYFDLKKGSDRIGVASEGFLNYEIFTKLPEK